MSLARVNKNEGGLQLLNQLSGDFSGLIIGTFGANLEFAESQLFGLLSKSTQAN